MAEQARYMVTRKGHEWDMVAKDGDEAIEITVTWTYGWVEQPVSWQDMLHHLHWASRGLWP